MPALLLLSDIRPNSLLWSIAIYYTAMSREDGPSSRVDGSQAVSREEFRHLFTAIGDMQSQLSSMKRDLSQDRGEVEDRLVKHLRLERKTSFKKKGNEGSSTILMRR